MDYSDTTIVIPTNDEPAVAGIARKIAGSLPSCRIIVVYLGKKPAIRAPNVTILRQRGRGYGSAIRQGFAAAKTPVVGMLDADGTYDPKDLRKVVQLVRDGADLAVGSRLSSINSKSMPFRIWLGNALLTLAYAVLYFRNIGDSQSGLRAMSGRMLRSVKFVEDGMSLPTEMNGKAARRGFRIAVAPISYYPRIGEPRFSNKLTYGFKLLSKTIEFRFSG
jgi:cellulose synthase/poly-beta-1,6-N-acetylglucosamine synthase-like glycosyltransferase